MTDEESLAISLAAAELEGKVGKLALHVETGRISVVSRVFVDGGWRVDREYVAPDAYDEGSAATCDAVRMPAPFLVFESGDAFWIKPGAFVFLPDKALALSRKLEATLSQAVVGFAVVAKSSGLSAAVAKALLVSALDRQAAALRAGPPG